jgi:hypothetical protein
MFCSLLNFSLPSKYFSNSVPSEYPILPPSAYPPAPDVYSAVSLATFSAI